MSKCLIITWFAIYKNWTLWYKGWVQWAETSAHQPCDAEDGHREPRQAHTSLWCRGQTQGAQTSAHKPMMQRPGTGSRDKCPPASRCRGWARGAQTSAHKPVTQRMDPGSPDKRPQARDAEAGPMKLRQGHRSPAAQRGKLRGLREAHRNLHDTEGTVGEPKKDPHKPLPSKLRPAVQGGTG